MDFTNIFKNEIFNKEETENDFRERISLKKDTNFSYKREKLCFFIEKEPYKKILNDLDIEKNFKEILNIAIGKKYKKAVEYRNIRKLAINEMLRIDMSKAIKGAMTYFHGLDGAEMNLIAKKIIKEKNNEGYEFLKKIETDEHWSNGIELLNLFKLRLSISELLNNDSWKKLVEKHKGDEVFIREVKHLLIKKGLNYDFDNEKTKLKQKILYEFKLIINENAIFQRNSEINNKNIKQIFLGIGDYLNKKYNIDTWGGYGEYECQFEEKKEFIHFIDTIDETLKDIEDVICHIKIFEYKAVFETIENSINKIKLKNKLEDIVPQEINEAIKVKNKNKI